MICKKPIILASAIVAFALPQTAAAQMNGPVCGTEMPVAPISREFRSMTEAAVAEQAGELLLYVNFNANGSVVRPGFGNADTLTSSIITGTRFCPAPLLSQEQKDEIVQLVSDEFSPFNIRVTVDAAEFAAYPRSDKQMALVTTVPSVAGFSSGTGGVAPFGGFGSRLPADFAFVFSGRFDNDPRAVAAVISHESAHLLGLGHQHLFTETCGVGAEYHPGFGFGPLSFDPLMGDALSDGINNWFAQSCPDPTFGLPQNDFEMINSQVVLRPDDFPDDPSGRLVVGNAITGVLERAGDVDFIKINFRNPSAVIVASDNIDLKVSLLTPGGGVVGEFNDPDGASVTIPSANGMRYLKIEAAGNDNMPAQFMTGTYRITY